VAKKKAQAAQSGSSGGGRGAAAKKKASTAKAVKKKKTTSAAAKRTVRKKAGEAASAKKTAKKKTASRKKSTVRKAAVKKKTAAAGRSAGARNKKKKTSTSAAKTARKSAAKTTSSKKVSKTSAKKAVTKKAVSGGKTSKKVDRPSRPGRSGGEQAAAQAPSPKREGPTLDAAKAVAQRFAAAAGLRPVEITAEERALEAARTGKRLTKSPLTKRELAHFRKLLLQKRAEVIGDVSAMEEEALRSDRGGSLSSLTQHMADQGSDEYEQSLALGLAESQRKLLKEIDEALERIDQGVYGVCEVLGVAIPKERLEARPWAKTSLEGAKLLDRGLAPGG